MARPIYGLYSTSGSSQYFNSALLATATIVQDSFSRIYGGHIINPNAATVYLQLFNFLNANITVGTTVPTKVFFIPAMGAYDIQNTIPFAFNNGFSIAATTTATGLTAPGTGLVVSLDYL
jgi:hypothetical protein